jgi:4-hydroxy-3-methylbut-2-enyl diphosphate reductase
MEEHGVGYSSSGLVAQMRTNGNVWKEGEVTVKLAKAYGESSTTRKPLLGSA